MEAEGAFTEVARCEDLCGEQGCSTSVNKKKCFAGLNLTAGADQRAPLVRGELSSQKDLDTARRILGFGLGTKAGADGEEARGQDAGVVEDEEIAAAEMAGEIGEVVVGESTGAAIHPQHAAGAANLWRMLRDEFFGEFEVEVGDEHKGQFTGWLARQVRRRDRVPAARSRESLRLRECAAARS